MQHRIIPTAICAAAVAVLAAAASADEYQDRAGQILENSRFQGGLIVHLGCGDGRLTAALATEATGSGRLVHGLDTDAANVEKARGCLRSLGLYGNVSVETFDGRHLPYADNLVNLVVAEDLGDVSPGEVMRVLRPGGAACVKRDGRWEKTVKPWPAEIDQWTHFLHDASNNAVAEDVQVGPPRRLKWVCGPLWTRSHEFNSSLCAMVSAGGRVFYIFDEGLTGITSAPIPEKWTLIARDAFNGLLLWKRPMSTWGSRPWRSRALRSIPPTVPRRLVADENRVFVTLGDGEAVSILDAATGVVLTKCPGTEGTEEIRATEGVLLLRKAGELTALEAKTGKKLWDATGPVQPLSPAAQAGKVFYQAGKTLRCLRLADGRPLWQAPAPSPVSLLVVHGDRVLLLLRSKLQAVSASTGRTLWTVDARIGRRELFVAGGRLWHWEGDRIVGRDLGSGEVTARPDTDDVFTRGHHLRCYQSKATERFLITPNRGAEFVSLTGGASAENDWVRGPCRYGVMPCNGLLYVPPNPCFCYPGVKLIGFNALAPAPDDRLHANGSRPAAGRLERGPAYSQIINQKSEIINRTDWPTYRHDARRSGATVCEIPPELSTRWKVRLEGPLTPPVAAAGRVYVAAKDAHTLYALDIERGRTIWRFTAAGRIDSPPTVYGEMVLFGGADGRVYCLRAADGELVWRFRAAASERRIIAFDQLESPWRVHGSVLVTGGVAYFTAGRSTYLDGGIRVFGLDPKTGEVLHSARLDTRASTRKDAEGKPFIPAYHIEGALSDILVSQSGYIYLGQYKFDRALKRQDVPYVMRRPGEKSKAMGLAELIDAPYVRGIQSQAKDERVQHDWQWKTQKALMEEYMKKYGCATMGHRKMGRHLLAVNGFLDDSWYNRTFWMYSETWPGYHFAHLGAKAGQLISVGPKKTYAVQSFPARNLQSPLFTPGKDGYLLLADDNDNEPIIPDYTRGVPKGIGFTRASPPAWFQWVPVRIRGMVLAGEHLFLAGPPDVVDPDDPMAAFDGRKGGVLWAVSSEDGVKTSQYKLAAPPVFDGLIAADGRLLIATTDGRVECLAGK